jgi:hypothetical protein
MWLSMLLLMSRKQNTTAAAQVVARDFFGDVDPSLPRYLNNGVSGNPQPRIIIHNENILQVFGESIQKPEVLLKGDA